MKTTAPDISCVAVSFQHISRLWSCSQCEQLTSLCQCMQDIQHHCAVSIHQCSISPHIYVQIRSLFVRAGIPPSDTQLLIWCFVRHICKCGENKMRFTTWKLRVEKETCSVTGRSLVYSTGDSGVFRGGGVS